jgi:hypothetical protein
MNELPVAHAVALRLRSVGAGVDVIAAALDIPPKSVAIVLRLAEAKLRDLLDRPSP